MCHLPLYSAQCHEVQLSNLFCTDHAFVVILWSLCLIRVVTFFSYAFLNNFYNFKPDREVWNPSEINDCICCELWIRGLPLKNEHPGEPLHCDKHCHIALRIIMSFTLLPAVLEVFAAQLGHTCLLGKESILSNSHLMLIIMSDIDMSYILGLFVFLSCALFLTFIHYLLLGCWSFLGMS